MSPIKVEGSEKLNRAAGREWLVESHSGEWRLIDSTARISLATYAQAREKAVRYLQTYNFPTRIRNAYTGDTEHISIEAIIHVHPKGRPNGPNVGPMVIEHAKTDRKRYYLVTTETTCMKCRPDKGKRYAECDEKHPQMVLDPWWFLRRAFYYDPHGKPPYERYWPTELAVDGVGFVNLPNALKAAEQAKASIFDSHTWLLIPYESVVTALIMFKKDITKLARKAEAAGMDFWGTMS
jgi:hypothetical protein